MTCTRSSCTQRNVDAGESVARFEHGDGEKGERKTEKRKTTKRKRKTKKMNKERTYFPLGLDLVFFTSLFQ
jgi:hypothetical protein